MIIIADSREKKSGLIDLIREKGIPVEVNQIPVGDYIINNWLTVERKTARDFLISIITRRLFYQLRNLREQCKNPILLVEGDPYKTDLEFNPNAVRGAFLSIKTIWYIPVVYSRSKEDTRDVLIMIGKQDDSNKQQAPDRGGYRPKRIITRQLYVLQGFPNVGPQLARRILARFKSISGLVRASTDELMEVKGIGKLKADKIREILDTTAVKN